MRVRRIDILRSPGIDPGFSIEGFADGLTIIEGRNESGKSTLARAIRALLWPGPHASLDARGRFEDDGKRFYSFVDVHGGGWQGEAPRLPDASAGHGIIVGISDLWQDDDHDQAIRQAMARELQGGYDISALRVGAARKAPTAPMRDAREAERELAAARSAARTLMAQEAALPALRVDAEQARQEAASGEFVKRALERCDVVDSLAALRHQLGSMPEGALRVSGNEARRVKELREAIAQASASMQRERRRAAEAGAAIDELGLPEAGVAESDLQLLSQLANEAEAIGRQVLEAQREEKRARAEAHAIAVDGEPFDTGTLDRLDEALDAVQKARERLNVDRVAADQPERPEGRPQRVWLLACVVAALLAAIAAGLSSAWFAAGFSLLAGFLALGFTLRRTHDASTQASLLRRAEQSEKAYTDTVARLRQIAGDDPELLSTLSLVTAARRVQRQDKHVSDWHAARAGVESLEEQLQMVLARAMEHLARYGSVQLDTTDDLTRALAELRHNAGEHRQLRRTQAEALERAAESADRMERAQEERRAFLEYLGISEDRLDELQEWLRLRQTAQELAERVRTSEALLAQLDQALRATPELLELDRASLQERLAACREAQDRADGVLQQIGGIEKAIVQSRERSDVGKALGAFERAAAVVAEARDEECAKAARRLILEHAVQGLEREDMPALLRAADELMAVFTSRAYGLTINDEGQPVVRDERAGEIRKYEQLSTGTRAQALLAMRLAAALDAERRAGCAPLPLVLDEPLATTDDQRFEAVVSAIFGLAREGRQLVYLTCEPAHALRLERLAREHALDSVRHDLDSVRGKQNTQRNPADVLLEPKAQPSPSAMTREAYLSARGTVALDPWASPEAIDLYHLLPDDLTTLHSLDRHGLRTIGQVLAEQRRRGEAFAWPHVARAAECARRLVLAWRRGRSRPLTTHDLIESGAVSDKFLGGLAELNVELRGSAVALMEAIEARGDDRVKGFRSDKAKALREFLESSSLLPGEAPLDRSGVIAMAVEDREADSTYHNANDLLSLANRLLDQLDVWERAIGEAPTGSVA